MRNVQNVSPNIYASISWYNNLFLYYLLSLLFRWKTLCIVVFYYGRSMDGIKKKKLQGLLWQLHRIRSIYTAPVMIFAHSVVNKSTYLFLSCSYNLLFHESPTKTELLKETETFIDICWYTRRFWRDRVHNLSHGFVPNSEKSTAVYKHTFIWLIVQSQWKIYHISKDKVIFKIYFRIKKCVLLYVFVIKFVGGFFILKDPMCDFLSVQLEDWLINKFLVIKLTSSRDYTKWFIELPPILLGISHTSTLVGFTILLRI